MHREEKIILSQWIFPTLALIGIMIGMIFNFNVKSNEIAANAVEQELTRVTERYANQLSADLGIIENSTRIVAEIFWHVEKEDLDIDEAIYILNSLHENTKAYLVALVDNDGIGVTHTGTTVDLSNAAYFINRIERGVNIFVNIEDDEILGNSAVMYIAELPEGELNVISYYSLDNFGDDKRGFDGDAIYMLFNGNNKIAGHSSNRDSIFLHKDLIDTLRVDFGDEVRRMYIRLINGMSSSMKVEIEGESRSLIYSPLLAVNNWYLIVAINEEYISGLESKAWEHVRRILSQLGLVITGFLGVMVLLNVYNKLSSTFTTKELSNKADTDLLTGLMNKVATEREIKRYMKNTPNEQAMLFVLDIDDFKKINDTMGHAFGDEVLRSLGNQITPIFRSTDIIGRIGGDEIIIFLKKVHKDEFLLKEAEKVARFFHEFKAGEYVKYSATASIGVAIFPRDGTDFESLYKAADKALYVAKRRGKNQLAFHNDTFDGIAIR